MGVRVHCFPLISIRLIQIQTKQLSNFPQKKWTNMCKPSLFPNSHDWFIKKFHFMDEKITVHLQSGGWHPSLPKPLAQGRAPWTHPPMQQQSKDPHFLTPPGEKKTRWDHAERHVKETDMVEILLTSCKGLMIYHDLYWFISFTWVSQYEWWVDDSCPNLNHPVVWHGVFDDHPLFSLWLTHMNARLFGSIVNVIKAFRKQHHFSFHAPPSMYKMSETLTSHGGWVPISGSPAQCRIHSAYPSFILEQISPHVLCLYLFSVSSDHLESRTIFPYHRSQTHLKKTFCRISFQNLPHLWKSSGLKQYGRAVKIHKK